MLTLLLTTAALALEPPSPTPEDFYEAHGISELDTLKTLSFTFHVQKGDKQGTPRSWRWDREANTVTRTVDGEALSFTPGAPRDDAEKKADAQWINDSFWFSPGMHLSWAASVDFGYEGPCEQFFSKGSECLRATYPADGGGYSPGDSYRLYLGSDHRMVGWDYLPAGADEPALTVSFAAYVDAGPLKVATEHRSEDGAFRLWFDGVEATTR